MTNLDPRAKFMIVVSISAGALFTEKIPYLAGLLAFTLAIMLIGKVDVRAMKNQIAGALGIIAFIFVIQMIFGQFHLAFVLAIRLMIIIVSALILLTGKPRDYLLAMVQCRLPYELAYMVILAVHFFPILKEETLDVYYSIQLRGTELKKTSFARKVRAFRKMCIPILAGALERAKDTSIAMEARGFRSKEKRTYMRRLKLKKKDIAIIVIMPVLAALFLLSSCGQVTDTKALTGHEATVSITSDDSVSVSWSDTKKYSGQAECDGKICKASSQQIGKGSYYRYSAVFTGLDRGKSYDYSVGVKGNMSLEGTFRLAEEKNFSFLYMGDIQYMLRDRDYKIWGELQKKAFDKNRDAAFEIFTGDMVDKEADYRDWQGFFQNGEEVFSQIPVMTTAGNHETSQIPRNYFKAMNLPANSPLKEEFYSFDYGDCHFLALNSCFFMSERRSTAGYERDRDKINAWIKRDLAGSKAKWKIVYMHHPMYPLTEDDEIYGMLRDNWGKILADNGVNLVLCGHQHAYMRTKPLDGITYVMARSGEKTSNYINSQADVPDYAEICCEDRANYVKVTVGSTKITVKTFDSDGKKIDKFTVK